ncbi:MAG: SigB/SigF/SigG family RNA polymerase sigma factor [Actinobacteria bacterium]|nr:SigB/SigF/SigG family RNA polymerase sigma factor [Actinomycetota bacterium]
MRDNPQHSSDELIRSHLPLARRLAMRYRYTSEPIEDLVQVASMGLVLAAKRFDPMRGASFPSFAVPTIVGELRRHIRDHGWSARVPRSVQENILRIAAASDDLSARLGRSPTPRELSDESGLDVTAVLEARLATHAYEAGSLDSTYDSDDERSEPVLAVGVEEPGYDRVERAVILWPAVRELPDEERAVIAMRFLGDLTQSQIAERIGVSQMQVSRLLRRALNRIQAATGPAA